MKLGVLLTQATGLVQALHPFVRKSPGSVDREVEAEIQRLQESLKKAEELLVELTAAVEALAKHFQETEADLRKSMTILRWATLGAPASGVCAIAFTLIK